MPPRIRAVVVVVASLALLLVSAAGAGASGWTPYDRPATYTVTTDKDVPITVRDGTVLSSDVERPTAPGRYPVIVIQTPYNKNGAINTALGGANDYLAQRGYAVVTVDVRGTGGSQGVWDSFGTAEQLDGYDVVEWAAAQPWSDGRVGLAGPSYMGLNQLYTAALRPPHLKAIFPIVPMADGYRDITFSGGDLNVSFIPLWLGLVTAGGLTPPTYALDGNPDDAIRALGALDSHVAGVLSFQANTILDSAAGTSIVYDGPFWKTRSPLEVVDRIDVPAFVIGGLHDLFQRGEPLVYERLRQRVFTRLLIGPWTHLEGSTASTLPAPGVPEDLSQLELRWFDRWLKGMNTDLAAIPPVTQYVYGDERFENQPDWPDPKLAPQRLYLRGAQQLSPSPPAAGEAPQSFLQQPLSGICTQSTSQWTAGLTEQLPCTADDRPNEALGNAIYTTPPLSSPLRLDGPILADVWTTTTARDEALTVRLTDVDPSGASRELTTGWLAASLRAVDPSRGRYVRGQLIEPWHPFTQASVLPVTPGVPNELQVEVFPTAAVIKPGDRLRVAITPSDFPHQLPPVPQLAAGLGGQDAILTDPAHPSFVELPELGSDCAVSARAAGVRRQGVTVERSHGHVRRHLSRGAPALRGATLAADGCPSLPVPNLFRG